MFGLAGTLVAVAGRGDVLERHLLDAAAALVDVDDCLLYVVSRLPDEPESVHVTEVWTSEAAHRASLELPAVQELIGSARPVLAGMGERQVLSVAGGKGLPPA